MLGGGGILWLSILQTDFIYIIYNYGKYQVFHVLKKQKTSYPVLSRCEIKRVILSCMMRVNLSNSYLLIVMVSPPPPLFILHLTEIINSLIMRATRK